MKINISDVYMAGFFDGEGYIGLLKRNRSNKYTEYFIQMSIGQNDGKTMDWIIDNYGGHLHLVKRDNSYYWIASNRKAYEILKRIIPHLKYKKPQAELAISFFEGRHQGKRCPPEEIERREYIYKRLKEEKRVYTKAINCNCAGSTTKRINPKGMQ